MDLLNFNEALLWLGCVGLVDSSYYDDVLRERTSQIEVVVNILGIVLLLVAAIGLAVFVWSTVREFMSLIYSSPEYSVDENQSD